MELHTSLPELQRLWGRPADDPMVEAYPVAEAQRPALETWAGMDLDLVRFDYFVAAYTIDLAATRDAGGYMGHFPSPLDLPAFPDAAPVRPRTPG